MPTALRQPDISGYDRPSQADVCTRHGNIRLTEHLPISVNLCMVALGTSAIVLHRSDSDRTLLSLSAMYDVVPGSRAVCSYTGPSPRIRLGQWLFICRQQFNS